PEPDAPLRPGSSRAAHEDSPLGIDRNVRLTVRVDGIDDRRHFKLDRRPGRTRAGSLRQQGQAAGAQHQRASRGESKSKTDSYFMDSHANLLHFGPFPYLVPVRQWVIGARVKVNRTF